MTFPTAFPGTQLDPDEFRRLARAFEAAYRDPWFDPIADPDTPTNAFSPGARPAAWRDLRRKARGRTLYLYTECRLCAHRATPEAIFRYFRQKQPYEYYIFEDPASWCFTVTHDHRLFAYEGPGIEH